jgi:flagellar biogenesis protein FliO
MSRSVILRAAIAVSALLAGVSNSGDAHGEIRSSSVRVEQEAHSVVVRIDNMQVDHNTLQTRGDRIYIELPTAAAAQQIRLQGDKTVKMVEIKDGRHPRISVKMRHGRDKTRALGGAATIENLDGGIIMHIPRWPLPKEVAAPAAAVVASTPVAAVPAAAAPALTPATLEGNGSALLPASAAALPTPKANDSAAASLQTANSSEGGVSFGLLFGIVLLLAGGGVIVWRSRQTPKDAASLEEFRIIATKQLGGKSKVVWLSVGSREMVVSVGEAGTQLLSEWSRDQQPALAGGVAAGLLGGIRSEPKTSPMLAELQDSFAIGTPAPPTSPEPADPNASTVYDFRSTLSTAAKAQADIAAHLKQRAIPTKKRPKAPKRRANSDAENSPSVAGLLKLRDQAPQVSVEVATDDPEADAEWARELFKATRENVLRRMD